MYDTTPLINLRYMLYDGVCCYIIDGSTFSGAGRQMSSEVRASAGAGVVIPVTGMGRIEINLGAPIRAMPHDQRVTLQFGIGADFT